MTETQTRVRIDLTPEQKKQVKGESGRDVIALELATRELEQRINPLLVVIC